MLNDATTHFALEPNEKYSSRVLGLLSQMTLTEKIGQLCQVSGEYGHLSDHLGEKIRAGHVGSIINEVNPKVIDRMQKIARHESRLGIPLLIGRDVIHGFKTIFPIPLGQAATWSVKLVEKAARIAALEASRTGVNWTFAPMIDISRDPRWGRIAESLGEDPLLCSVLGKAMVDGFQAAGTDGQIEFAACAKHFAGYGASESGRDYCTTNIPENELRNIYLPPFKMAADAGVATFMASFSDLDGVPASANQWLMTTILRQEWGFLGFVVSDWESISQLEIHGLTASPRQSAQQAFSAGIDMEMVSTTYQDHLADILAKQEIDSLAIDQSVLRILSVKERLGLFDDVRANQDARDFYHADHLQTAKELAIQSCVLLQNRQKRLPLSQSDMSRIALIGPLADDGHEQLGTWVFDGESDKSVTLFQALTTYCENQIDLVYEQALETTRSHNTDKFASAIAAAEKADVAVLCLGEEAILSGEAHCRSDISLPGKQQQLIKEIARTGTPIVLIVMAGRPLTLGPVLEDVDSVLYAWHPGTMAGQALVDLLFGQAVPSGKLPVTFPRVVGQIPIYYNQKHTGKPANEAQFIHQDAIPARSPQTSLGMAATHLDTHFTPQFPFGFGLSYSQFKYSGLVLSAQRISADETLHVSVLLSNVGEFDAEEVVQLYIRDRAGSVTRPVRELKGFQRVFVKRGEQVNVEFLLRTHDLRFYRRDMTFGHEPGMFDLWVGGSSSADLHQEFELYYV